MREAERLPLWYHRGPAAPTRGLQVALLQDPHVVGYVAGRDESERPDRKGVPAGHPAPAPRPLIRSRPGCPDVLVKAGQRAVEASRKPECAEHEHPLAVVHVAQELADAPLVGGVAMERPLL